MEVKLARQVDKDAFRISNRELKGTDTRQVYALRDSGLHLK